MYFFLFRKRLQRDAGAIAPVPYTRVGDYLYRIVGCYHSHVRGNVVIIFVIIIQFFYYLSV